ncbi:dockerin type I domain-containing protein [Porcipelethomonas sp.]|uniref:dockerin type I domain-containing protein n=1 Tax=Porcipelethomonas sp. TaxID=2981675 RepID=UPI003EF4920E
MKKSKMLSMILSGVMAFSMAGSIAAAAEDSSNEDLQYMTLAEILELDKEEFLSLDGAEDDYKNMYNMCTTVLNNTLWSCYNGKPEIESYLTRDNFGVFMNLYLGVDVNMDDTTLKYEGPFGTSYRPYETEKYTKYILGDAVEYEMESPLQYDGQLYGCILFTAKIKLDKYFTYEESDNYDDILLDGDASSNETNNKLNYNEMSEEEKDEIILYYTKIEYSLQQLGNDFKMLDSRMDFDIGYKAVGEANNDGNLDIRDASFIAQKLASGKADELPDTADFNSDGKTDVRDAALIAQFMTARSAAKAEGLI